MLHTTTEEEGVNMSETKNKGKERTLVSGVLGLSDTSALVDNDSSSRVRNFGSLGEVSALILRYLRNAQSQSNSRK